MMEEGADNDFDATLLERAEAWANVGITFTSENVFGKGMSLKEVVQLVTPLDRDTSLLFLSSLSIRCTLIEFATEDGWRGADSLGSQQNGDFSLQRWNVVLYRPSFDLKRCLAKELYQTESIQAPRLCPSCCPQRKRHPENVGVN